MTNLRTLVLIALLYQIFVIDQNVMITSSNGLIWHYPDIHFYAHWKVLIPQACGQYSLHRHTLNILYLWLYTNIVDLAIWRVTLKNIFYPKISTKQIVNKEVALLMNIVKIVTCRALFLRKHFSMWNKLLMFKTGLFVYIALRICVILTVMLSLQRCIQVIL